MNMTHMFYSALKSKVDRLNRELASKDDQLKSAEMKILNTNELHSEQVSMVRPYASVANVTCKINPRKGASH